MKILDGKTVASRLLLSLKEEIASSKRRKPCLAAVLVGNDPASAIYVGRKTKACEEHNFHSIKKTFPEDITEDELIAYVTQLNKDPNVDGILVQLPLPKHISEKKIITLVDPQKDVDGFHPVNLGKLVIGDHSGFIPCTPLGIKTLLLEYGIDLEGKHVVIVGRSTIVGKPLALLLMQKEKGMNATVTVVHRGTRDLTSITRSADVLIAAIGVPLFIKEDMVKEGAIVIDVGINRMNNKIVGDVDFENVAPKCSMISKVPGGIGPMTIAMLLFNTFKSWKNS